MKKAIEMDFGGFVLDAELFDTPIAEKFVRHLPCKIQLTQWGNELYGPIGPLGQPDLGEENPVADIPAGGIAYTRRGNYVCVFFGQRPAWAVEHIGQINENQWKQLVDYLVQTSVTIRSNHSPDHR